MANSLRPADAEAFRAAVEKSLAEFKETAPAEKPEVLREAIWKAAQSGATFGQLVEQAVAVRKAVLSARLNEDEIYQQRLKEFEDAVRAEPKNPDRLTALAEFLTREAKARYERTPTGQFRILRREVPRDPEGEFARAERLADAALAINSSHAAALVARAGLLRVQSLRQGGQAAAKGAGHSERRTGRFGTICPRHHRRRGPGQGAARISKRRKPVRPSPPKPTSPGPAIPAPRSCGRPRSFGQSRPERLQRAHEIFEAVKLRPNDATGFFDLGIWRLEQQDLPGAEQALEKAVQLDPHLVRGHEALAKVYRDRGMNDRAYEEESLLVAQAEGAVGDFWIEPGSR